MGGALTKPRPTGLDHPKREISNFAGMSLEKELTKGILRGPLKFLGLIQLRCYLTNGWKGVPLLNRFLLGGIVPNAKLIISPEWA